MPVAEPAVRVDRDSLLPLTLLSRYLLFLGRRPVSSSNSHFLQSRIAALQSLAWRFENSPNPVVRTVAAQLRSLTCANFHRLGPAMQIALVGYSCDDLPRDFIVSREKPELDGWRDAQRVLIVFGPGIGVGDEILCFP